MINRNSLLTSDEYFTLITSLTDYCHSYDLYTENGREGLQLIIRKNNIFDLMLIKGTNLDRFPFSNNESIISLLLSENSFNTFDEFIDCYKPLIKDIDSSTLIADYGDWEGAIVAIKNIYETA